MQFPESKSFLMADSPTPSSYDDTSHSTTSVSSRSSTPSTSTSTSRSQSHMQVQQRDEVEPVRQLVQKKNIIYIGIPGIISVPPAPALERTRGIFHLHNPTTVPISWNVTPTAKATFKRLESNATRGQSINDEVFSVIRTNGFLRPGQSERIEIEFRPKESGLYSQSFVLVDSATSEECNGSCGAVLTIQATGLEARRPIVDPRKRVTFEVSEQQITIPATRVGRVGQVNIRIENPTNVPIRLRCRCEIPGGGRAMAGVLSVSAPTLTVKAKGTMMLPLAFRPKTSGEVKGTVTIEAMVGKTQVKVGVTAEGLGGSQPVPKAVTAVRVPSRANSTPVESTRTQTPTQSPTQSPTQAAKKSSTQSSTLRRTQTPTRSSTPTHTQRPTRTQTLRRMQTLSCTPTRTQTPTPKPTPARKKGLTVSPLKTSSLVTSIDHVCDSPTEISQTPGVASSRSIERDTRSQRTLSVR